MMLTLLAPPGQPPEKRPCTALRHINAFVAADHGPVHVKIVTNIALRLLRLLVSQGVRSSVVDTYISYLRKKLDHGEPKLIHTIRGVGFCLRTDE